MRNIFPKLFFLPVIFCLGISECSAQARITTLGLQFKPIFPVDFLGTGKQTVTVDSLNVKSGLALQSGYAFGMVIRKGFTDLLALEVGINYVRRKYHLDVTDVDHIESSDFRIIGYEIPASLLVYIRLGGICFHECIAWRIG